MASLKIRTVLCLTIFLSGCTHLEDWRNMRNLSESQKQSIYDARTQCPRLAIVRGELQLAAMPVLDGGEVFNTNKTIKFKGDLNDRDIITGVWYQRACLLARLNPQFKEVEASKNEVFKAAENWPTFDAANYAQLITTYRSAKEAHIAEIRKKYGGSVVGEAIPLSVLNAAMPYQDFLNIVTVDVSVKTGEKFMLKGQKIGGSAAKICLKGNEYSTAIRPALDQTRTAAIAIGGGKMTAAEGIEMIVMSVYEAGTIRLLDAKEASDRQIAPVSCTVDHAEETKRPAAPKDDQGKPPADKKPEVTAPADKKTQDKQADKTTVANVPFAIALQTVMR
ncbi:hypothetical protein [Massilia sp. DD77]|uniref:hypothetical protein n=1 Tax=Massilia sp. DD77 TaxID=3109349 RepID=UPI002FFF10F7